MSEADDEATPQAATSPTSRRRERKSLLLRLDPAVHEALAKWAADDLRSLNSHIELLLRDALRKAGREAKAAPLRKPGRPSHESRE
ncbi:toxin-antitoxin system HicB family antitoxin [Propioniciclava flava]